MRFLGAVFISILSTQAMAENFEDRLVFQCKDKYVEMARMIGYKSPAVLYRAEDGTYFTSYEKLEAHLESNKRYNSLPFQKAKATNTAFLVYDKAAISELQIKEASLVQFEDLEEKKKTAQYELSSLTRIYNDERSDRIKGHKPKKRDVPLTTQMRTKKQVIAELDAQIEKMKSALPKHLMIKDSILSTVSVTEAQSSYSLNLKEKCQVENFDGKVNPCQSAQAPELCGAYTGLLAYDQSSNDRARASTAPASSHKPKSAPAVKVQN